jgi:hypothetical protein
VVLSMLYRPCPWEGLNFPDLMLASDIGCDFSWLSTWCGGLKLFGPPLAYK